MECYGISFIVLFGGTVWEVDCRHTNEFLQWFLLSKKSMTVSQAQNWLIWRIWDTLVSELYIFAWLLCLIAYKLFLIPKQSLNKNSNDIIEPLNGRIRGSYLSQVYLMENVHTCVRSFFEIKTFVRDIHIWESSFVVECMELLYRTVCKQIRLEYYMLCTILYSCVQWITRITGEKNVVKRETRKV